MPESPPAATPGQLTDIQTALTNQQNYINKLVDAMNNASNLAQTLALVGPFKDANAMKEQLIFTQSTPNLTALNAHIHDLTAGGGARQPENADRQRGEGGQHRRDSAGRHRCGGRRDHKTNIACQSPHRRLLGRPSPNPPQWQDRAVRANLMPTVRGEG